MYNQQKCKLTLLEDQVEALDELDFVWDASGFSGYQPDEDKWMMMYHELVFYKKNSEHGDCNVRQRHSSLGRWVAEQRQSYKKGKLSAERAQLLNNIGFQWVLTTSSKKKI